MNDNTCTAGAEVNKMLREEEQRQAELKKERNERQSKLFAQLISEQQRNADITADLKARVDKLEARPTISRDVIDMLIDKVNALDALEKKVEAINGAKLGPVIPFEIKTNESR